MLSARSVAPYRACVIGEETRGAQELRRIRNMSQEWAFEFQLLVERSSVYDDCNILSIRCFNVGDRLSGAFGVASVADIYLHSSPYGDDIRLRLMYEREAAVTGQLPPSTWISVKFSQIKLDDSSLLARFSIDGSTLSEFRYPPNFTIERDIQIFITDPNGSVGYRNFYVYPDQVPADLHTPPVGNFHALLQTAQPTCDMVPPRGYSSPLLAAILQPPPAAGNNYFEQLEKPPEYSALASSDIHHPAYDSIDVITNQMQDIDIHMDVG